MPDLRETLAFEPFSDLSGVLSGAPIRVFPVGTYYRGERKLTVTRERLQEFAANIKAGLPRFEIPVNLEHKDEIGRFGSVLDLEYIEQGVQGPGLYATRYELTPAGRQLLEQEKFIGLSGEAIWTLFDGAKYQDPQTGKSHDNVLVGLALTNKPFFGKQVNLYSADASDDGPDDMTMKCAACSKMNTAGAMKCSYCGASMAADKHSAVPAQGAQTMAEDKTTPPAPEPEKFTISAEEFKAQQEKADKADKMGALVLEMKRARRVDQLAAHVKESFAFIPVKADELAEKMADLENFSPDLYTYFDGLLVTLGRQVDTSELFSQHATALPGGNQAESFDALVETVLTEKFNGDRSKYAEAMRAARLKDPALFAQYENTYSVPPSKTAKRA